MESRDCQILKRSSFICNCWQHLFWSLFFLSEFSFKITAMLSFNQLSLNFACKSISWRICQFQKVFRGVIGESGQESWAQKFPGNMKLTCVCGNFQKWLTIGCMVRVDLGVIMFKSIIISSNNYISGPLKRRSPQLFRKGRWMTFHSWANLSRGHCFSRRPRFRQTQDGWQGKGWLRVVESNTGWHG